MGRPDNRMFNEFLDLQNGFFAGNIATNIFSTCAIIYRILHVANASGCTSKRLYNAARILAESGLLYTLTTVFLLIGIILGNRDPNSGRTYLVNGILGAINYSTAGITFNIILIRVYQDRLRLRDSYATAGAANGTKTLSGMRFHTAHSTINRTMIEMQFAHQPNEEYCAEQDSHARGDYKPMSAL